MPIDSTHCLAMLPVPSQSPVRPMFRSLGIASSGLATQRQRMETIAQNIANADVTRGAEGVPYKRRDVILETATAQNALFNTGAGASRGIGAANVSGRPSGDVPAMVDGRQTVIVPVLPMDGVRPMNGNGTGAGGEFGVRVAGIAEDAGEGRLVYEPGHPDADASGYVRYPDIDTTQELVHLLDAKRMYEANASVFQTVKAMLRAAIDI